jgi:hypothetical protein
MAASPSKLESVNRIGPSLGDRFLTQWHLRVDTWVAVYMADFMIPRTRMV